MAETRTNASALSSAADKLLAAHDGDVALLYIYIKRYGAYNAEDAAHALCRTLREIRAAEEKLRRMGLWSGAETAPAAAPELTPEEKAPEHTAADLTQRAKEDANLATIFDEGQQVFRRKLSSTDLKTLYAVYDDLGLPVEVILELLHFCAESAKGRLTARQVEKEAYIWANREILTLEQAEEYIRRHRQRGEDLERVRTALGIRDRSLSPTETECINSWLDMGFREEAIVLAYDRTVTKTGAYKLRYMDTILKSWHAKNLHTPQEIEARDGRGKSGAISATGQPATRKALDEIFDKI